MAGRVLLIEELLEPDHLACRISNYWCEWDMLRAEWIKEKEEVQRYIFATDTTKTSNAKLPWSNKTTTPKLCQIRDNLYANYLATMFPNRKWLIWEGESEADEEKKSVIENYMAWVVDRNEFYDEVSKLVLDYIDYGNCFSTVDWEDNSSETPDGKKIGYIGPKLRRISPMDIVFNPIAESFDRSPKIIRSLVSLGEAKEMLEAESAEAGEIEDANKLYQYMKDIRYKVSEHSGSARTKDVIYDIAGFATYQHYLDSGYVEVLTFYGDYFDEKTGEFHKNQIIKIVDRHKILSKRTAPSFFSTAPIFHAGWRIRPDNLWAMGPLDNLVGMQYRIDHLENMKADVWDLTAYPMLKIKGYAEDFNLGPLERIYVGDDGDVEILAPDVGALQANLEISMLEQKMEEMAGSPKEAMGFRTPGEKTMYEVQRLENAASRIFQNKTGQFERQQVEPAVNAMLESSRRLMSNATIRLFDSELKIAKFKELTAEDITGHGRIKPIAARHFAEQATQLQNLNNFYASPAGQDPEIRMHMSSVKSAQMFEHLLDMTDFNIVQPYVRISEQADAQRLVQSASEQVLMEGQTAAGIVPGDHDSDVETSDPVVQGSQQGPQNII